MNRGGTDGLNRFPHLQGLRTVDALLIETFAMMLAIKV